MKKIVIMLSVLVICGTVQAQEGQLRIPPLENVEIQERLEKVVQEIHQQYPPLYDQLLEVQDQNTEMYHILLEELIHQWGAFVMLKQENPEIADLEIRARTHEIQLGLLEQEYLHQNDDGEKARVKEEIRNMLLQIFEVKVQKRQLEIARLQKELQTMQEELTQIIEEKDTHVERKLQQITEGDVFTW
jgi:hypothetical protein